jgi:hypothetical protein
MITNPYVLLPAAEKRKYEEGEKTRGVREVRYDRRSGSLFRTEICSRLTDQQR